jgi:hypothetical protein
VVLYQLLVQGHVFLFGENGIVRLEPVLVQQSLVTLVKKNNGQHWVDQYHQSPMTELTLCPECQGEDSQEPKARSCQWKPCWAKRIWRQGLQLEKGMKSEAQLETERELRSRLVFWSFETQHELSLVLVGRQGTGQI